MERDDLEFTTPGSQSNTNYQGLIDLHSLSLTDAEHVVNYWLFTARSKGITKLRFVTGRGNHLNAKGERGTLYKSFLAWIEESSYKEEIERCEKYDGYYEVFLKPILSKSPLTNFFQQTTKQFIASQLENIKTCAEKGEVYFQLLYAQCLEKGEMVKQDFKLAFTYYCLAAKNGYPAAMFELARCYLHGIGVRQSDQQAVEWLKKAHQLDDVDATVSLGDCYMRGHGVKPDGQIAVSYYAKAAALKNPSAMRKLASAYLEGIGVPKNCEKSFFWYKAAADLGDTLAQYNTAAMYKNGTGTLKNDLLALPYYELAAKGGDPDAQFFLGEYYFHGHGVVRDLGTALYWIKSAATHGSAQASHWLSKHGEEKTKDYYLKRSAQSGNFLDKIKQQTKDKTLSEQDIDVLLQKEITQVVRWQINDIILLQKDSKFLLLDGMLLKPKKKYNHKALLALQMMAEQDCIFSLRRLGKIFYEGFANLNIKQDIPKALEHWQKAIKQNDSKSMLYVAHLYEQNFSEKILPQDIFQLYQKAADLGNPLACYQMGIIYRQGLFEQQVDVKMARLYLTLAIKKEETLALSSLKLTVGLLDKYESIKLSALSQLHELNRLDVSTHAVANSVEAYSTANDDDEETLQESGWLRSCVIS